MFDLLQFSQLLLDLLERPQLILECVGQSLTVSHHSLGGQVVTLSTQPEPGAWRTGLELRSLNIIATCTLRAMEQGNYTVSQNKTELETKPTSVAQITNCYLGQPADPPLVT